MRKSIKKVLALGSAAVMALSLAACGGGTSGSTQTDGASLPRPLLHEYTFLPGKMP